ncbi:hypothetical protein [Egicoccus halophilus]|uniref:Uncharacterized protein n=1 Tax=Egicoccus halophilus TaxID=1670830 RepID=A0A8J3ABX5_9ACTN|nr:hypothetical protein [Egicoccus halophilus]GGI07894.1 hypothetical protein GCM10011354_26360 [Egicoccus halophilus]
MSRPSAPGPVERALRDHLAAGTQLQTPTGAIFTLATLDERGIVLLLGQGQSHTRLPWEALEEIPGVFDGRGWLLTTGTFDTESEKGSLSAHLKRYVKRETANWVAVVLEEAGVLELDRSRPVRARLRDDFVTGP